MSTYRYTGISKEGMPVEGVVQARSKSEAVIAAKADYSIITSVEEVDERPDIFQKLREARINEKKLSLVCKQFAIILTAGMPIVKTVELVADQTDDKTLHKILVEVAEDVGAGYGIAESFQHRGPRLPTTFIETVRAGEESGSLDVAFERLSAYFENRNKTRSKVSQALVYPTFVICVAIIVIAIIMAYAVPMFSSTFLSLGIDLPLPTRILIGMSDFFQHWMWLIVVIAIVLVVAVKIYGSRDNGRYKLDELLLHMPVFGKVQLMSGASQFANTLSTMLAAGLTATKGLSVTGRSMTNFCLSTNVLAAAEKVEAGYRIGTSLREREVFPNLLVEMTAVGEESGSMEDTLAVIGKYYDNEVEVATQRVISLLEPSIIVVLAVFVVLILLAVYMPMFQMYGGISASI